MLARAVTISLAALLLSCGGPRAASRVAPPTLTSSQKDASSEGAPLGLCDAPGLCWEHPRPQGNDLRGIAVRADDDVVVVGARGTILFFDGERWASTPSSSRHDWMGVYTPERGEAFVVSASGTAGRVLDGQLETWRLEPRGLSAVTGSGRADVYALGEMGLHHFNGSSWRAVELPDSGGSLVAAYARAADDVWVAASDRLLRFDGERWRTVALPSPLHRASTLTGTAGGDVFVGGVDDTRHAVVAHFDGEGWDAATLDLTGAAEDIAAVGSDVVVLVGQQIARSQRGTYVTLPDELPTYGYHLAPSPTGAWLVGPSGEVRRLDAPAPDRATADLHAVWGRSPTDVYAVGDGGAILHRDARGWSPQPSGVDHPLRAVWGHAHAVYAVGDAGTILRHDGSAWAAMESGTEVALHGVGQTATGEVIAVGASGAVLTLEGDAWRADAIEGGGALRHVATIDGRTFVLSGSAVHERVGDGWRSGDLDAGRDDWEPRVRVTGLLRTPEGPAVIGSLGEVFVQDPDDPARWVARGIANARHDALTPTGDGGAWAVEAWGRLTHFDGRSFHWSITSRASLEAVWSSGLDVFAVGEHGAVVHLDVAGSIRARGQASPVRARYFTAIAADDDTVYLGGLNGALETIPPGRVTPAALRTASVLALASRDGRTVALGAGGRVERVEAGRITLRPSRHPLDLTSAWLGEAGTLFAVGFDGAVLRQPRDGEAVIVRPGGRENLTSVFGLTEDHVLAVGNGGTVLRFDGAAWSTLEPPPSPAWLTRFAAGQDGAVFGVGPAGRVATYRQGGWYRVPSGTDRHLRDVHALDWSHVYAVGDGGVLLVSDGERLRAVETGVEQTLWSVHAASPTHVVMAGLEGAVLLYDGERVTVLREGSEYEEVGYPVAFTAGEGHALVGHRFGLMRLDEDRMQDMGGGHGTVLAIDGRDEETIVGVGAHGYVGRFDGYAWEAVEARPTSAHLRAVLSRDDGALFVGGDGGALFRSDGDGWARVPLETAESLVGLFEVGDTVHAFGSRGTRFIIHGDEVEVERARWSPLLTGVAANAPDDAVVVGHRGTVLEWDGDALVGASVDTDAHLRAVWAGGRGRYVAVGDRGAILARVDGSWTAMESPTRATLTAVYGRSWDEIYATGAEGTVLRYDGARWSRVALGGSPR